MCVFKLVAQNILQITTTHKHSTITPQKKKYFTQSNRQLPPQSSDEPDKCSNHNTLDSTNSSTVELTNKKKIYIKKKKIKKKKKLNSFSIRTYFAWIKNTHYHPQVLQALQYHNPTTARKKKKHKIFQLNPQIIPRHSMQTWHNPTHTPHTP